MKSFFQILIIAYFIPLSSWGISMQKSDAVKFDFEKDHPLSLSFLPQQTVLWWADNPEQHISLLSQISLRVSLLSFTAVPPNHFYLLYPHSSVLMSSSTPAYLPPSCCDWIHSGCNSTLFIPLRVISQFPVCFVEVCIPSCQKMDVSAMWIGQRCSERWNK